MAKYMDREYIHRAHADAWDGTTTITESPPCSSSYHPDLSKASYDQPEAIGPPVEQTYEPYVEAVTRAAGPSKDGQFWYRALHGDWVRLTPYHASRISTQNFLVRCRYIGNPIRRLCSKLYSYKDGAVCMTACSGKREDLDWSIWDYVGDMSWWQTKIGSTTIYQLNDISYADVVAAGLEVQQEAINKSYATYDMLTELFEMRETSQFFMSTSSSIRKLVGKFFNGFSASDLRAYANVTPKMLQSALSRAARKVGGAWMAYRYALMPLLYSMKDIMKVIDQNKIITSRATRTISPYSLNPNLPSGSSYITQEVVGSVVCRAAVVAKYSSKKLAQFQQVALNPLSTAWELIPYSFVFDWILNVGDYITNNFSASFASDVGCCKSTRVRKQIQYRLHHSVDQTLTFLWDGSASTKCWPTNLGSKYEYNTQSVDEILRTITYDTYYRWIFSRGSSNLMDHLNPSLSWKRICDAMVLTNNQFRGLVAFLNRKHRNSWK